MKGQSIEESVHTLRTGVHEKIININVLKYAQVTRTMITQLAQKIDNFRCCVISKMCLICRRMLSFAA